MSSPLAPQTRLHPAASEVLRAALQAAFMTLAQAEIGDARAGLRRVEGAIVKTVRNASPDDFEADATKAAAVEALTLIAEVLDEAYDNLELQSYPPFPVPRAADQFRPDVAAAIMPVRRYLNVALREA